MNIDLTDLDRLIARVRSLGEIKENDVRPLMKTCMSIIVQDNRNGILAGTDKDGNPMKKVTYRPTTPKGARLTQSQKNNVGKKRRGIFAGLGDHPAGTNNNLTSSEYRKLSGPPLAPRGAFSRVITNLETSYEQTSNGSWAAVGRWNEVVNTKDIAFLKYHFQGKGRLPKRDLRGVRPEGREKARQSARAWLLDYWRSNRKAG